jgi:hypothetical protein
MVDEAITRKLAFVLDNEVVDILHTDDRLAAIFLSNPKVIDITEKIKTEGVTAVLVNSVYDEASNTFFPPTHS